ncbi:MAG: leucyl aminopeptidase [Rickettsia sp.]|nr:leucyl aminopeptidase [Rickettsia sp.]
MLKLSSITKFTEFEHSATIFINNEKQIISDNFSLDSRFPTKNINDLLLKESFLEGKLGEIFFVTDKQKEHLKFYIIISLGKEDELNDTNMQQLGCILYNYLNKNLKISTSSIFLPKLKDDRLIERFCENFAIGALVASYQFDKYKSDPEKTFFHEFTICMNSEKIEKMENIHKSISALVEGIFLTKDLSNEPANILTPDAYAGIINNELSQLGVEIQTLSEIDIRRFSMNALLAVGQGSINEARVVIMKYTGNSDSEEYLGLVGKGVTFDTGGISLKPPSQMDQMKYDMAGSAAIVGLMKTLALRASKVNVVSIIGLVENMPGSNAQRPGDVVSTMSGKTVEVLNTDAEGRLVLCDCMHYLQTNFKVTKMIDLATLTGAIIVALGNSFAGCFSNDDKMANDLKKAGLETGERIWQLPLDKEFKELLSSKIADIANIPPTAGGKAGSATAAEFLFQFVQEGVSWIHLDIAGVHTYPRGSNKGGYGSSAFGVKLLNQFIKNSFE